MMMVNRGGAAGAGDPGSPSARVAAGEEEAGAGKVKLLCSFAGRIAPRSGDGALRYVGGQTRLISVPRAASFEELMRKVESVDEGAGAARVGVIVKYQLPGEDLDSLIAVSCAEDYDNMMEEYEKLAAAAPDGSAKLPVFLFPASGSDAAAAAASGSGGAHFAAAAAVDESGQRCIDAVNCVSADAVAAILQKESVTSAGSSAHNSEASEHAGVGEGSLTAATTHVEATFGNQSGGTRIQPYVQTPLAEAAHLAISDSQFENLVSISGMPSYRQKSHEELRWEDYRRGDKGETNSSRVKEPLVLQLVLREESGQVILGQLKATTPLIRLVSDLPRDANGDNGGMKKPGLYIVIVENGVVKDEAFLLFREGLPDRLVLNKAAPQIWLHRGEHIATHGGSRKNQYSIVLRIWPSCHRSVPCLHVSGNWKITRKYVMEWSNSPLTEEGLTFWSRNLRYVEFIGSLESCEEVGNYIQCNMNPDITGFKELQPLGQGGYAYVFLAKIHCANGDVMPCAIKVKHVCKFGEEDLESRILSGFTENDIVGFHQAWTAIGNIDNIANPSDGILERCAPEYDAGKPASHLVFIQMEFCPSDLKEYITIPGGPANMPRSSDLFEQVVVAVGKIHKRGIVHCDLKPGNIFIGSSSEIKIGDFGQSSLNGERACKSLGTFGYSAPEINYELTVTSKVDSYGLGSILFSLFHNCQSIDHLFSALYSLRDGNIVAGWPGNRDLLLNLTGPPNCRLSANEIMEFLHPTERPKFRGCIVQPQQEIEGVATESKNKGHGDLSLKGSASVVQSNGEANGCNEGHDHVGCKHPTYDFEEQGLHHTKLFTCKVTVHVDTFSDTVVECLSDPKSQKKAAQEQAAEGVLWCLKCLSHVK